MAPQSSKTSLLATINKSKTKKKSPKILARRHYRSSFFYVIFHLAQGFVIDIRMCRFLCDFSSSYCDNFLCVPHKSRVLAVVDTRENVVFTNGEENCKNYIKELELCTCGGEFPGGSTSK